MSPIDYTLRHAKRLIIMVVGITVIVVGVAMIVLPGPAIIVIPVGLAILATEFVWARNLLHRIRDHLPHLKNNPVPTHFPRLHRLVEKLFREGKHAKSHKQQPPPEGDADHQER